MKTETKATATQKEVKQLPVKATEEKLKTDQTAKENAIKSLLNPSAEQRMKNLDNFNILASKHRYLLDRQDEVNKFSLSADGTKEKIRLSNSSGFSFEVTNTQTIEKVIDVIKSDLNLFIERSEKEILTFNI